MAVYNSIISRAEAAALIPEDVSREIIQAVPEQSNVMRLGRRLANMTRAQLRMPVISLLPTAYFVAGDTGLKQTSEVNWENKYIDAEELAVIIPIADAVIADADYDIWAEVRPLIAQAMAKAFDAAVLVGANAPASWPTAILAGATAATQTVDVSTVAAQTAPHNDLYTAILGSGVAGAGGAVALVENDGFMVNGHIAHTSLRGQLRNVRGTDGHPIFLRGMQEAAQYTLDGEPVYFDRLGSFTSAQALDFAGDWQQLVYSIRQDITFRVLTEGVISDAAGVVIQNLAQQDMVALRVVMRLGWELPNPPTLLNTNAATRYPFAVLVP